MSKESKREGRLFSLLCEWDGCCEVFTIAEKHFQAFSRHVAGHVSADYTQHHAQEAPESEEAFVNCRYQCLWSDCRSDSFANQHSLLRHVLFHAYHTKLKLIGQQEQQKVNANPCELDNESRCCIPENSYKEDFWICGWEHCSERQFSCADQFYRHLDEHAALSEPIDHGDERKTKQVKCYWNDCGCLARNKYKLKEHCRVHSQEKVIACPTCGSLFASNTKFLDHLTRQNAEAYENYQCSHCLKRCASERLLRDHMRHHVNHLKCPSCDMTCPNPSSLREHIKFRHTDDRPFKCSECNYSCKAAADLQRHEETHLPKRYRCTSDGCQFTSKTLHSLKRHAKERHEVSLNARFACHICGLRYTRGTGLTTHLKAKHNFQWPSGFPRFRYREYEDGLFRLQMVRFESAELTQHHTDTEDAMATTANDSNHEDMVSGEGVKHLLQEHVDPLSQEQEEADNRERDMVVIRSGESFYVVPTEDIGVFSTYISEGATVDEGRDDESPAAASDRLQEPTTTRQQNEDDQTDVANVFINISPSKFASIENNFDNVNISQDLSSDVAADNRATKSHRKTRKRKRIGDTRSTATDASEYDQRLDISQTLLALQESASTIK